MTYTVNYVLSPFKGNINGKDPQGIKLYLQTTKDIKKEADKLDISVSNAKYVVQIFLSLAKKYFCRRLAFMVETSAGDKNIFCQVENIQIADMQVQAFIYFGLGVIGNVNQFLPNPLFVSALQNLANNQ